MKKKIFALIMSISMITQFIAPSYASMSSTLDHKQSIFEKPKDDGMFINNVKITVEENEDRRITKLFNQDTKELDEFILDKSSNRVYSSITNSFIDLNDDDINKEPIISTKSSKSTYKTYYLSFAKLKSMIGNSSTVASVVGAIISITGLGGKSVVAVANHIKDIGAILSAVNLLHPSKKHGVKVTVKTIKYYRWGRKVPYQTNKRVSSIGLY